MKAQRQWLDAIERFTGLDKFELIAGNRKTEYARARALLAWVMHRDGWRRAEIDRFLGTSHGSARYMIERAEAASKNNDRTLWMYMECISDTYHLKLK